jgi:hypothetical protein
MVRTPRKLIFFSEDFVMRPKCLLMLVAALSVVSVASATHIPVASVADNLGAGTGWGFIIDDVGMSGDTQTTADTITNDAAGNAYGGGVFNTPISYIEFDLGQDYLLDEIWIWNYNHPNLEGNGWRWSDWKDISIQISPDGGPYDTIANTEVGLADGTTANEVDLVVDGIGGVSTRYIRFHTSPLPDFNWGGFHNQSIVLGEVRFYEIPEPATLALLSIGGLLAVRRKRR